MGIDIEGLLSEIPGESPCGEDLGYDPAYIELEGMAQGKAEQVMGDQVIAGEEPNWGQVKTRCLELAKRTRDLRVTMYLTIALLKIDGLGGMRDGLALLRGMIDKFWDQLYPLLDPDDDNDPTERVNIIDSLAKPAHTPGDPMQFQQRLRETPLCSSKQLGRFSLRDIAIAKGECQPTGDEAPPSMSNIDAAFMDTELEDLQANAAAIAEAVDYVKSIENSLNNQVGTSNAPSLVGFVSVLEDVKKNLDGYLTRRGVGVEGGADAEGGDEAAGGPAAGGGAAPAAAGEIRSRQDVVRMLDKACDYYMQHEPSSPVPLLLMRAKRLASKNFIEIIRDLTPDAVKQVEVFQGIDNE